MRDLSLESFADFVQVLHGPPQAFGIGPVMADAVEPAFFVPGNQWSTGFDAGQCTASRLDTFSALGTLLRETLGCTEVRMLGDAPRGFGPPASPPFGIVVRRPVASGGARYPVDITVMGAPGSRSLPLTLAGRPLHYAPQYHRLFEGEPSEELARALWPTPGPTDAFALVVRMNFMRTWEKYRDFGYRLSAVDAGIVVGRLFSLASGWADVSIDFDHDAQAIDAALNLREHEASYCVLRFRKIQLPTSLASGLDRRPPLRTRRHIPPGRLSRQFREMHAVAHATPRRAVASNFDWPPLEESAEVASIQLPVPPEVSPDAPKWRRSQAHAFDGSPPALSEVSACLHAMQRMIEAVHAANEGLPAEVPRLLLSALNVVDLSSGTYAVGGDGHSLLPLGQAHPGRALADALLLKTFDMAKSAFVVHLLGRRWGTSSPTDPKTYRIQQMLVGAALDAGMLAASGRDRSGHAYLGFDTSAISKLYGLSSDELVLAQLCVGAVGSSSEIALRIRNLHTP